MPEGRCICTTRDGTQCSQMIQYEEGNKPDPFLCERYHSRGRCTPDRFVKNAFTEIQSRPPSPTRGSPPRLIFGAPTLTGVEGTTAVSPPRSPQRVAAAENATTSAFGASVGELREGGSDAAEGAALAEGSEPPQAGLGQIVGVVQSGTELQTIEDAASTAETLAGNLLGEQAQNAVDTSVNVGGAIAGTLLPAAETLANAAVHAGESVIGALESGVSAVLQGAREGIARIEDLALGEGASIHLHEYVGPIRHFQENPNCTDINGNPLTNNHLYANTLDPEEKSYAIVGTGVEGTPIITLNPPTQGQHLFSVPCNGTGQPGLLSPLIVNPATGQYEAQTHSASSAAAAILPFLQSIGDVLPKLPSPVRQPVFSPRSPPRSPPKSPLKTAAKAATAAVGSAAAAVGAAAASVGSAAASVASSVVGSGDQNYILAIELTNESSFDKAKSDVALLMTFLNNGTRFTFLNTKDKTGRNLTSDRSVFWGTSRSIDGLVPTHGGSRFLLVGSFASRKAFAIMESLNARIMHDEKYGRDMKRVFLRKI